MGTSPSKHHPNNADRSAALSRSLSFPSYDDNEVVTSEKNSRIHGKQDFVGKDMCEVGISSKEAMKEGGMSVSEKNAGSRSAVMSGLKCKVRERIDNGRKQSMLVGSAPVSPMRGATDEASVSVWGNKLKSIKVKPFDNALDGVDNGASFRCAETLDGSSGLKLLLSPVTTPSSRSMPASSRFANVTKNLSSSGRLNYNPNDDVDFSRDSSLLDVCERESDIEGMDDSEESGSPLFDPSILATFERAIEASSDDNWQTSEVSTSSSSRIACSSADLCSDADSPNWPDELVSATDHLVNEIVQSPFCNKKSSKASGNHAPEHKDYLGDFELKCPAGCEDKIVLYFTSLRGVRKTYENCCLVRVILKGFGVSIDARDIWMHSKYKEELTNLMGATLSVPRLFIRGRHIGGAEDVKRLHEEGIIEYLLEGFPAECNGPCSFCGGVRFMPCNTCGGSCKIISAAENLRCPDCNENGLMLCPSCGL